MKSINIHKQLCLLIYILLYSVSNRYWHSDKQFYITYVHTCSITIHMKSYKYYIINIMINIHKDKRLETMWRNHIHCLHYDYTTITEIIYLNNFSIITLSKVKRMYSTKWHETYKISIHKIHTIQSFSETSWNSDKILWLYYTNPY